MNEVSQNHYLAVPKTGSGPGLLVLHAWWGLNDFIKGFCDRLTGEGFVALAPDLYHGKIASTVDEAKQLRSKTPQKQVKSDITSALDYLHTLPAVTSKPMAVIGHNWSRLSPSFMRRGMLNTPKRKPPIWVILLKTMNGNPHHP
jgi:dienelactone hydrolase